MALPERVTRDIQQPTQQIVHRVDGLHIREVRIPQAGTYVPQHSHVFAHATILASGSMRVWEGGRCLGDFSAPHVLNIAAQVKHTMLALTDDVTFYCAHNTARTGFIDEHERHEFDV